MKRLRSQVSAWWPGLCPQDPARRSLNERYGPTLQFSAPPAGGFRRGQCFVIWVAVIGRGPQWPNPWTVTLAMGTWNVTSLRGKEPELVREVERYWLEIVGLTSTHSLGSGTQLLERGWTLFCSGVAAVSWCGLAYSSPSQPSCAGVLPGEREGCLLTPLSQG